MDKYTVTLRRHGHLGKVALQIDGGRLGGGSARANRRVVRVAIHERGLLAFHKIPQLGRGVVKAIEYLAVIQELYIRDGAPVQRLEIARAGGLGVGRATKRGGRKPHNDLFYFARTDENTGVFTLL